MAPPESSVNWQKVRAEFLPDKIGRYVINDSTLCSWGNGLTIKDGYEQKKYIRDKLRVVGTLCINYHKVHGTDEFSVKEIFKTKFFFFNFKDCSRIVG